MDIYNYITEYSPASWSDFFKSQYENIEDICQHITDDYIPRAPFVFSPFYWTSLQDLKVVILGQDPYTNPDYACGIAFSTNKKSIPESLSNIYDRLCKTINGYVMPEHGDLRPLASRGVLLMNSALTVVPGQPDSHSKIWKSFTAKLVKYISDNKRNVVFILLGGNAGDFRKYIDTNKHHCLQASHPSGRGLHAGRNPFISCDIFNECNKYLESKSIEVIDWQV